jgi:hypothetical protein
MDIVCDILAYERERGAPASGSVSEAVLRRIVELAPKPLRHSVETGSGKTTVLLSQLADHHPKNSSPEIGSNFNGHVFP